jgi:TfoX-like protein
MAYDEDLADRIRALVAREPGVSEKRLFGGLGFLINGNLAVSARGHGGLMVRCDPAATAGLIDSGPARRMVMRGREMAGWLQLETADVESDEQLERWTTTGITYAKSLPNN